MWKYQVTQLNDALMKEPLESPSETSACRS
jgi:hypothetical protein